MSSTKTSVPSLGPKIVKGSLFDSSCSILVNTVNCVGAMGAGVALEARLRFPKMYNEYVALCKAREIQIGKLWLYREGPRGVLNFPTKDNWRNPTKEAYLHAGLERFMESYQAEGITSVAFPILGASNGGLDPARALSIMQSYLQHCNIPVEIYEHDPVVSNRLFAAFKDRYSRGSAEQLSQDSGLSLSAVQAVKRALDSRYILQFEALTKAPGLSANLVGAALIPLLGSSASDCDHLSARNPQDVFVF